MRKNLGKILSLTLAASLAFATPAVVNVPTTQAAAASSETLTGTKWWTGKQQGVDYAMAGKTATLTLNISADKLDNGYGAFSVELYDATTGGFITTGSDVNAWTEGGFAKATSKVEGTAATPASALTEGNKYTVTVTRTDNKFNFLYKDTTRRLQT